MSNTKRALGTGINALIAKAEGDNAPDGRETVIQAEISSIDNDPAQPRKAFDLEKLQELADSIKVHGIMQPILVREENGRYLIIAGERRYRAARLAGLNSIPVIVREFSDRDKLEAALIENLQREDLNPMEQAAAISQLMENYGLTQAEVSERVGKNRSTIANLLRLLDLPEDVAEMVRRNALSASHAKTLLPLIKSGNIGQAAKDAVAKGWSVRQTEDYVRKAEEKKDQTGTNTKKAPARLSPDMAEIQETLSNVLETKVRLKGSEHSGQIIINFYGPDQLEQLYDALCTFTDKLK